MGVPCFYRWLVGKYPKIVVNAIEKEGDTSQPNPNGMEFHNLYLDMNGIIHPCFHPEDQLFPPTTYAEVFNAVFEYIDRIFRIVRPRRLLYLALDGVAPRAKMNQQRSRRFRAAKDAENAEAEEKKLRKEFESEGKEVLPKEEYEVSDPTVITPGTIFMERLSKALEYYTRSRLNSDPGWASIKVILSDASVPGEGEHKIMSYIRLQRNLPGYDHDTRHCLYGLDADLIMLALATHEVHFFILREDVLKQEEQCISVSSIEASLSTQEFNTVKSRGWFRRTLAAKGGASPKKPYQFLNVWTLREYLALDMTIPNLPFEIDIERIVDDFIFICLFIGNDFIPTLPTLEIHEGAIDLLISVYKKLFMKRDDYLIDASKIKEKKAAYIKVKRLEQFLHEVGSYEDMIFEKRYKSRQKNLQRWLQQRAKEGEADHDFDNWHENTECRFRNFTTRPVGTFDQVKTCVPTSSSETISENISAAFRVKCSTSIESTCEADVIRNTKELKQKLKDLLREQADLFKNGAFGNDKVKLGIPGWRGRYYKEKFSAESPEEIESTRLQIVEKYMEGICWVLQYYFAGVCSWGWYCPFNYGPFASDLKGLCCSKISFKIGSPFKPFDQLMAVLPARSFSLLPKAYRNLMNSEDSPIIKFYPSDFSVDTDGKRFAWQGIARLPFIDETLILNETKSLEKHLEIDEMERNISKYDKIIVLDSHILGKKICSIYTESELSSQKTGKKYPIDGLSCEINGFLSLCVENSGLHYSSPVEGLKDITEDHAKSVIFQNPDYHPHVPKLLPNATLPDKTLTEADIDERKLWHEYERPPQQNTSQHRYAPRTIVSREPSSPASTRKIFKGSGSGWSGVGRGNEAMSREHGIYGGGNPARSIGRGHGSSEVRHFGQCDDSSRGFSREPASPASTHEIFKGSGSGWSGVGRGNEAMSREHGIYGGENPARSIGRGHGSSEVQQFGQRDDSSRGNHAAHWNQQSRSENWRCTTAPVATGSGRGRGRGLYGSSNTSNGLGAGPSRSDLHGRGERRTGW